MLQSWPRMIILPALVTLAAALLFSACVSRVEDTSDQQVTEPDDSASSTGEFPVTVTRTDGVELTLESAPERIVSLSPGATETFFAIGAGDQLVAVDMFSNYPPESLALPQLDAYQPDPEAIVDLEPDLVFVVFDADGIVDRLEDLGLQVFYLDAPNSLDELVEQVRTLGRATGNEAQARDLASEMSDRIDQIARQAEASDETPSIYHELDELLFSAGPESFVGDLYKLLGARNIAEGAATDYPQLSEEAIIEEDPEIIIVASHGPPDGSAADAVTERPGWDVISAVQNERVYEIDGDIVSRPGPRIVDALEQLAEMIYPEEISSHDGITTARGNLGLRLAA